MTSDGVVSIFDLVVVTREFGKSSPDNAASDVNRDGIVNVFDLVLVAAHFGAIILPAACAYFCHSGTYPTVAYTSIRCKLTILLPLSSITRLHVHNPLPCRVSDEVVVAKSNGPVSLGI